jgi:hypothetical protein
MIDENFKVYLIEANTNPSLEICCPLLARIIPELLDNSFRIAIDPLFQPPTILEESNLISETNPKPRNCSIDMTINPPSLHNSAIEVSDNIKNST